MMNNITIPYQEFCQTTIYFSWWQLILIGIGIGIGIYIMSIVIKMS